MQIEDLRQFLDKTVTLRMTDGEVAKVRIDFIDQEYQDVIAKVFETSQPEHYRDENAVYTFVAADIVSAELSE